MPWKTHHLSVVLALVLLSISVRSATADPVTTFIVAADSLARSEDRTALSSYLAAHSDLVGAAVGQLLDVAFDLEEQDPDAARENVDFAALLAQAVQGEGGTSVATRIVETHRAWTPEQRATKRRAMELEAAAAEARQAGDPERDLRLLRQAAKLYASIDDQRALAVNWGTQGVAHWYTNDWAAVQKAYEKALAARRAIEDRILEGRTLNGLGSAYFQQNQFEAALGWYRKAIALRERTGDTVGLATSLTYASNCEQALGRLVSARKLLERALPVLEASGDDKRRLEVMHSVGVLYRNMLRTADAVQALEQALELVHVAPEFEAGIRLDLAGALREQGHARESIEQITRAAELAGDALDAQFAFRLESERGQASLALGDLDRAVTELERARDFAQEIGVSELVAQAEANLATAQSARGDHETALATATRALDEARAADSVRYELVAAQAAADALYLLGRYDQALALITSVLDEHDDFEPDLLIGLRITRGNTLTSMGRYDAAREELRAARRSFLRNGRQELEWVPLMGIGDSFETTAPDSAYAYYETAFAALERHRAATSSGAVRTSFLSDQRGGLFEGVVHFYAQQALRGHRALWSERAFRTAERARARGLLELVSQSFEAEDDPQIKSLLDALYAIDESDAARGEDRMRLQDELAQRFDARLAAAAPWAATDVPTLGPEEFAAALEPGMVALVYSVGTEASYVWVIDATGQELHALPGRARIQEQIVDLRRAIGFPGFGDRALAENAHALYQLLVEPAAARLRGRDRLWIVPDGVLFEIPFELLLTKPAGERPDWRRAKFLARDLSIGYAPSASLLTQLRQLPTTAANARILALGDPRFDTLVPPAGMTEPLTSLPQTRVEVEALSRLRGMQTVSLLGADATETRLRSALARDLPSIVHLATHGLVDREEPSLTSVALGRDASESEDGYLYTLEILTLPLQTEMVVLSACDTGRGKLERGEGTIGLTRSFLAAGARRVVASLWPVADASTSQLMTAFYQQLLREDLPVDQALNRARARLWSQRETAHPYYWAPFVLMGSDAALPAAVRGAGRR